MKGYGVSVSRLPLRAVFDLKGPRGALESWAAAALPEDPNRRQSEGGATWCHVGPGRWLVLADLADETEMEARLRPAEAPPEISVVKVSDTLAFFRIEGPEAAEVMATGCPLDLDRTVFGEDAVTWSEMFGLRALVMRSGGGFEVAVEQSFGPMVAEYLVRAVG